MFLVRYITFLNTQVRSRLELSCSTCTLFLQPSHRHSLPLFSFSHFTKAFRAIGTVIKKGIGKCVELMRLKWFNMPGLAARMFLIKCIYDLDLKLFPRLSLMINLGNG